MGSGIEFNVNIRWVLAKHFNEYLWVYSCYYKSYILFITHYSEYSLRTYVPKFLRTAFNSQCVLVTFPLCIIMSPNSCTAFTL